VIEIVHASSSWRDQERIIDYFDKVHAEDAAVRFLQALDQTIAFISEYPDLGNLWESSNLNSLDCDTAWSSISRIISLCIDVTTSVF